jgi:8-hydroxy-5-deazaflavin:NADPH oxidoreductase
LLWLAADQPLLLLKNATVLVEPMNGIADFVRRPVEFMHIPVPKQADEIFFAPLGDWRGSPATHLYLGLLQFNDESGNRSRIATARPVIHDFGVAAECGFGRTDPTPLIFIGHRPPPFFSRRSARPAGLFKLATKPSQGKIGMSGEFPTIAVVGGTGAEGSAIALRLGQAGYRVVIGTRSQSKGAAVVAELNAALGKTAIDYNDNIKAAEVADIVVLTVPYNAQQTTVDEIRGSLAGKILIDTTVPLMPPKVSSVQLPPGGSAVAAIQDKLGDEVRVVSAFQNVAAPKLRLLDADVACDVLVCADDADARKTVLELIGRIGLRGIDAGPICNSAAAEALTSVLIFLNRKYKVPGSGIKIVGLDEG